VQIVNSLLPVFLIIILGYSIARSGMLIETHLDSINSLVYRIGLPILLFYKVSSAAYLDGAANRIFLIILASSLGTILFSTLLARLLGLEKTSIGTFVQASFRGNVTFIGLPVVIYTLADNPRAETLAVLVLAPTVAVNTTLSVLVLLISQHKFEIKALKKVTWALVSNPLLIGALAGGIFAMLNWHLPTAIFRTCEAIGQMSLPLALIGIGGTLAFVKVRGNIRDAIIASITKISINPLLGYLLTLALGLTIQDARIALIYLCCPVAAASYVLTNQIGGNDALAASAVFISTILSAISLSFAVSF
jgi:predicted permease